ncbi:lysine-specific demethylase 8-like [Gryllus bimaculatus]|nr:lysine-specific demethylase 8-like [Gryllus bimaculatus]
MNDGHSTSEVGRSTGVASRLMAAAQAETAPSSAIEETALTVQRLLEGVAAAETEVEAEAEKALLAGALAAGAEAQALARVQAVLDRTWERLNAGHWSTVPLPRRRLYALASLHKKEKVLSNSAPAVPPLCSGPTTPVPTLSLPSLQQFSNDHFKPHLPVLLAGAANHWPAIHRWCSLEYLCHVAGARTVPVELGAHYVDPTWSQRLMTLESFVEKHVKCESQISTSDNSQLGYLAQHPLFDQVPELRADICIPEYCCLSDKQDESLDPDINAWFGPAGTVSPLHFDPKHNLLTQVVGAKRVLLYAPEVSAALYPHEEPLLSNTAQVDPENPDYTSFPDFQKAQAWECTLKPGDMLYIPPRWWHHVRSLSVSFSVSFWWE